MKIKLLILILIIIFSALTIQAQNVFPFACLNEKPSTEKDYKNWLEATKYFPMPDFHNLDKITATKRQRA